MSSFFSVLASAVGAKDRHRVPGAIAVRALAWLLAAAVRALAWLLAAAVCAPLHAQSTFKLLHGFLGGNDGAYPVCGVTLGPNGSIYGTTSEGGPASAGTVFYISPRGWHKVLYAFSGGVDGRFPYSRLMEMGGSFYGTTILGGVYDAGTVFKIDSAGAETVVHSFSVTDGQGPYGGLIHDAAGNLYGTTGYGSAYGYGNVYRLDPTGAETVIYSFTNGADGKTPVGRLARDAKGDLFGTTYEGGAYDFGTVFKIDASGVETVLYTLQGSTKQDGAYPGDLIEDMAGNLYAGVQTGGPVSTGMVFKVNQAGSEVVLDSLLHSSTTGAYPSPSLSRDSAGNIYGTLAGGGAFEFGGVFKLDTSSTQTLLYSFTGGIDGANSSSGVVRDAAGNLYGTTPAKGILKMGTVFELTFP